MFFSFSLPIQENWEGKHVKVVVHFAILFTVPFSGVLFSTYHAMFLIGLRSSENATLTRVLTDFSRTFYTLFIYSIGNFIYSLVVAIGMYIRPQKFSNLACTPRIGSKWTDWKNAQLWNSFSQIWIENLKFWNDNYRPFCL